MKAAYRNVMDSNEHSLRVSFFQDNEFPASWHFHPQYELTYIVSSSGMRYVGDSIHNFSKGDFVLVGTNLPHSWKTVGLQTSKVEAVIIQWNEDLLGKDWMQKPEFYTIKKMLELSARGIKFPVNTAFKMEERLMDLVDLPPFEKLMRFVELLNELSSKKEYTLLSSSSFKTNITTEDSDRISIIQGYVKNNVQSKIQLSEVASLVGLTEVSFCRYFKKVHNKTFVTFLNEFRIALACQLLSEKDHTVSEIGYQCGFNSISLFHRLFLRFIKLTPLEYRNSYKSIELLI